MDDGVFRVVNLLIGWFVAALPQVLSAQIVPLPEGATMGTTYHVSVVFTEQLEAERQTARLSVLQAEIDAALRQVNAQMSTYDPNSELSRFNASRGIEPFPVSAATARVVAKALELSELSDGAFDPTVAPLVELWNFGNGRQTPRIPEDAEIDAARARVGYQHLKVQHDPPALQKDLPELAVDLSAIAKGYGVDVVSELLAEQSNLSAFMVEIGGEVRTQGLKPDGTPWRISILKPVEGSFENYRVVGLSSESLATSGNYRNYFDVDGVRYSHTIDPSTGRPVTHDLASVSVLANDCMTADGVATLITVLGPEQGLRFAEEHGYAALLIRRTEIGLEDMATSLAVGRFQPLGPASAAPAEQQAASPWSTLLMTVVVFALALCGLAIGVLVSNRQLRGTCGGLQSLKDGKGTSMCEMCATPKEQCEEFRNQIAKMQSESPAE